MRLVSETSQADRERGSGLTEAHGVVHDVVLLGHFGEDLVDWKNVKDKKEDEKDGRRRRRSVHSPFPCFSLGSTGSKPKFCLMSSTVRRLEATLKHLATWPSVSRPPRVLRRPKQLGRKSLYISQVQPENQSEAKDS